MVTVLHVRHAVISWPEFPKSQPTVNQPGVRHPEIRTMLLQERHMPGERRGGRAVPNPQQPGQILVDRLPAAPVFVVEDFWHIATVA